MIAPVWRYTLIVASLGVLLALEIAVFGYFPGVDDPDQLIGIVMISLLVAILSFIVSFVSAVAWDINHAESISPIPAPAM